MTRPNVLIFMTDQQRGDTVLPEHPARTPVIDRFREDAVTFERAYCPSPHCCPSRTTFFTGLYPSEHGVWNNVCVQNALSRGPKPGTRLWSQDLTEAGYALHWDGKWHVSNETNPTDYGWQIGRLTAGAARDGQKTMGPEWEDYQHLKDAPEDRQRQPGQILRHGYRDVTLYRAEEHPFDDAGVVESAIATLRANAASGQPWCQYIGPLGPHDPYLAPPAFLERYDPGEVELPPSFADEMADKPAFYRRTRALFDQLTEAEHREALRHYLAFCSYEDFLFGQVLEALEASGQAENTVVCYLSDHGDYAAEHGLWCKGLPAFEGAYHVPAIVRWPGVTDKGRGRRERAFVSLADFGPTFLEIAGTRAQQPMSGHSLVPLLQGTRPETWREAVFTQSNGNELYGIQRSVRTEDWKYVYNGFDYDELYDLRADPHEMTNLAADPHYRPLIRRLCRLLWRFGREQGETAINDYIMVGFAPFGPAEAFAADD